MSETIYKDYDFLEKLLRAYKVKTINTGAIRCVSKTGIEDKEWDSVIFPTIKNWFKDRLKEVYCNVCYNHRDMIVYFYPRKRKENQDAYDHIKSPSNIITQFKQ